MLKTVSLLAIATLATLVLAGCATSPPAPGGLQAGKFVTMSCSENKSFQARLSDDGRTVRVRAHPGSAELEKQADGSFTGEGFVLRLGADGGSSLDHGGKSQGKGCKAAA
jgi:hypothetical protein